MPPIFESIALAWSRIGLVQKILLVGLLLGCLAAGGLLVRWVREPKMGLLYSGIPQEEAAEIVEKIRDDDVPYVLKDGGTSVYVPEEKIYSLRLKMASQGLPAGGQVGYRILDEEKIGTSPFTRRINYIRAVEGELAKSIQLFEGVSSARVHIAKSEAGLFSNREKQVSASVTLELKGSWRPTSSNVSAIVHLVAGSVAGLKPQNVTVVDSQGNLLSAEGDDGMGKKADTLFQYQRQVEEYYAGKVTEVLEPVLGKENISVKVNAVIERSTTEEEDEKYVQPGGKIVLKETKKEKSTPVETASKPEGGTEGETKESTDNLTTKEYQKPDKKVIRKSNPPGEIMALSVAVLVDLTAAAEKEGEPAATPLKKADVQTIVERVVGKSDTVTGKNITVEVIPASFIPSPEPQDQAAEEGGLLETILPILKQVSLGILVIGALLMLKIFAGPKQKVTGEAAIEGAAAEAANVLPGGPGRVGNTALRSRITHALQENPEEVRRLFLTWAESEEGEA